MTPLGVETRGARRLFVLLGALALVALAPPALAFGLGGSWYSYAAASPGAGSGLPDEEASATRVLRVCADPDNLPYSKRDGSGFENRIAAVVAGALKAKLEYVWLPQDRGFLRRTLGANACDALIGVPAGMASVLTTRPYYRSSYVFVNRAGGSAPPLRSFDDARIGQWRIGVPLSGGEIAATAGYALARAGAGGNVVAFQPSADAPAAERMLDALARGTLDAALVWGPQAGYFARRAATPLRLEPAEPPAGFESGFEASIAMGVARGHEMLRAALDRALDAHRQEIDAILTSYAVPRTDRPLRRVAQERVEAERR